MVHAVLRAAGPYSLRLTARSAMWTARMPAGGVKAAGGTKRLARRMKSAQIGKAMRLPEAFARIVDGSSKPTHTPATTCAE